MKIVVRDCDNDLWTNIGDDEWAPIPSEGRSLQEVEDRYGPLATVWEIPDSSEFSMLAYYVLMPTGVEKGVMAVCMRHDSEVSVLVVNSLDEAPLLANLAIMAAEHEAEYHGGPSITDPEEES